MELKQSNVLLWEVGKIAYDQYRKIEKDYDKVVLDDTSIESLRYAVRRANGTFLDINGMIRKVYEDSEVADVEWLQRATTWSNMKYEACVQQLRATREYVILMNTL